MKAGISSICCVLMIALAFPAGIVAQTETKLNQAWAGLTAVQPGSGVEVQLKDGGKFKGKLQSVSDTAVSIVRDGKTLDLNREKIACVWQVSRSLKKPVLTGAVLGAGTGVIFGVAVGGCDASDIICFDRKATAPLGAAIFGIVGALTGLVAGLVHHHKVFVYQDPSWGSEKVPGSK
jgi:hypothetical protein